MKKSTIIISILLLLLSCTKTPKQEKAKSSSNLDTLVSEKGFKKERSIDSTKSVKPQKTKEVFNTINSKDNSILFSKLINDLSVKNFRIEIKKSNEVFFHNCERNRDIEISGSGIRMYYIKSTVQKPKNFYPDFNIKVFEFKTETQAKKCYVDIMEALRSKGRFCNGKIPQKVVRNKNEIFYVYTRAEMFRGYVTTFAQKIDNY